MKVDPCDQLREHDFSEEAVDLWRDLMALWAKYDLPPIPASVLSGVGEAGALVRPMFQQDTLAIFNIFGNMPMYFVADGTFQSIYDGLDMSGFTEAMGRMKDMLAIKGEHPGGL